MIVGFDPETYEEPRAVAVEQWYDRQIRSWVTYLVDKDGYQVGDASFDGDRAGAAISKATLERTL